MTGKLKRWSFCLLIPCSLIGREWFDLKFVRSLWNFIYFEDWFGHVNFGCNALGTIPAFAQCPKFRGFSHYKNDTTQLKDLCTLIHHWGKGANNSLVSLSFWPMCRFVNLRLIFIFERTVVYHLRTDLWRLTRNVNKTQIPFFFFAVIRFSKCMLQNFVLTGRCHVLGLFRTG